MIVGFCRDTAPVCSLSDNETHQTQVKLLAFVIKKKNIKPHTLFLLLEIISSRFPEDHVR